MMITYKTLLQILFLLRISFCEECKTDKLGRIRTFSSLADYQGTRSSFDMDETGFQGNIVSFDGTIEKIEKNSFISFGSNGVSELNLTKKGVKVLEDGAFLGLMCLQKLDLSFNNVSNLTEGVFQGLSNLTVIDLRGNDLETIPDNGMALFALKNLKQLDLSSNKLESIPRISFTQLSKLETLKLSFNKLTYLDDTLFDPLSALRTLLLNQNYLRTIVPETWKNLNKLQILDLSHNYLTSFDASYNFSFVGLKTLNVSSNYLVSLNVYAMRRYLPQLQILDITSNNWFCPDLEVIKHQLKDSKVILHEGNCTEIKTAITPPKIPLDTKTTTTTPQVTEPAFLREEKEFSDNYQDLINKFNKGLMHLESIMIFFFVLLLLVLLINFLSKHNPCDKASYRTLYEEREYLDSRNVESMNLIAR